MSIEAAPARPSRPEQLIFAALGVMSDGFAVVDHHGRVLQHNIAAGRYLNPAGHCTFHHLDGTPVAADSAVHVQAIRGVPAPAMDVRCGDRILNVTAHALPHSNAHPPAAVVNWRDVTTERAHRDGLATFVAAAAHDLRSPLTIIESWTQLLTESLAPLPDPDIRDSLERIHRAAARMRKLIDDLLAQAATADAPVRAVPTNLQELVTAVASEHIDIAVGTRVPPPRFTIGDLPVVRADPDLLRQLLDNLIGNAIKYTDDGTTPHITISSPDATTVHIDDNGIGIPPGQHHAIFDDFHRAHPNACRPGTGLGLGICRRIAERHGGAITATTGAAGIGSRFTVSLPMAEPAPRGGGAGEG